MLDDFTLSIVAAGVALIVVAVLALAIHGRRRRARQPSVELVGSPLSEREQAMFAALLEAVAADETVFARVPTDEVLVPNPAFPRRIRRRLAEELRDARFDFIVCARADAAPRFAVELDDHADRARERKARGFTLARACRDAELPLLRWPVESTPTSAILRGRIAELLAPPSEPDPTVFVRPDGRREPILDLPDEPADDDGGR